MTTEISIIIISFNRLDLLKKCLKSLMNQKTQILFEVIIIDQKSTDGSLEYLKSLTGKDNRFRLDILPEKGLNIKRNRGIELANSPIIGFGDDDCVYDNGWVEACYQTYKKNPNISLITGRILPLNPGFKRSVRTSEEKKYWGKHWVDRIICWRSGCGNNCSMRKDLFKKIGNFDEEIGAGTQLGGGGDDTEFFYKAMINGYQILYEPAMFIYHPQPTSMDDYIKRSYFYYEGVSIFIKKKYLNKFSGILMILVRYFHSLTFLLLAILTFRKDYIKLRWTEMDGTIKGLLKK